MWLSTRALLSAFPYSATHRSVSAKKKTVLRRSEHVLRNKVILTGYTQAVLRAHYDYNPRRDTVRWAPRVGDGVAGGALRRGCDAV